ncbi:MAG: Zn-ribbon containing protein [Candidatus Micrarchaeia archaeon]
MHKCSKCGRAATSLEEIEAGCPCGSKVFIFDRQIAQAVAAEAEGTGRMDGAPAGNNGGAAAIGMEVNGSGAIAGNGISMAPATESTAAPAAFAVPETAKGKAPDAPGAPEGQEGKVPDSYFARTSFTNDDIENIKVLTQGVFILDVNAISKNPVVLKDEDEIYYVKLPLVQKRAPAPGKEEGDGKR